MVCFLNKDTKDKHLMISNIEQLRCNELDSSVEDSRKLHKIYEFLKDICECNKTKLQTVFRNICLKWFSVNDIDKLEVVKYLGRVNGIVLKDTKIQLNAARSKIASAMDGASCNRVSITNCKLEGDECQEDTTRTKLVRLTISGCRFRDEKSFVSAVQWGISSCDRIQLWFLNIKHEWWWNVVEAIQKEKRTSNGPLQFEELHIYDCTPTIKQDIQFRVRRFPNC